MMNRPAFAVLLLAFVLAAHGSVAQDLETISRPNIAAANCPAEWEALASLDPDIWAETTPIGIDPTFDQTTTDAFNKYFVWIMAQEAHVTSIVGLKESGTHTQSYMDDAKAKYDLATCLTMTPDERELLVQSYHAHRPDLSEDRIRATLFKAFDDYACIGLASASERIFGLDPESASFPSEYAEIMAGTLPGCS